MLTSADRTPGGRAIFVTPSMTAGLHIACRKTPGGRVSFLTPSTIASLHIAMSHEWLVDKSRSDCEREFTVRWRSQRCSMPIYFTHEGRPSRRLGRQQRKHAPRL